MITRPFNRSSQQQSVPSPWKLANVTPISKESPLTSSNQLRPISLTNIITRRLDWLPFKDEVNLQRCSLIFRRIRNEDDCPDYITKLLHRNSDLRSDSRASRYGRFNLLCPFYLVNTRMRSKRDIKMGRLCTPGGAVLGIVGRGVTFRFLNDEAILDENMLFWVR